MNKYTTRLVLKGKNKGYGRLYIEIDFNINGARIRRHINLHEKVLASYVVKGKIKSHLQSNLAAKVETEMFKLRELLRDIETKNGEITPELFDEKVDKDKDKVFSKNPLLVDVIQYFMDQRKNYLDHRTIQKYNSLKVKIEDFSEKRNSKSILYIHSINKKFMEELQMYYVNDGLKNSTINKYESCLNTVLDYCVKELKIKVPEDYKNFKKIQKEKGEKVVLLKHEIDAIHKLKTLTPSQTKIRDIFIFQILTGLRFSDLERVNKSWLKGDTLKFKAFKTVDVCQVPLHKTARAILEKYNWKFQNIIITNQHYNRVIKDICEKAEINEENEKLSKVLNKKTVEVLPKYKLISSHSARSTFITHCIIAGITPFVIMKYVGHKKITTLQTYVEIADAISDESFDKFEKYMKL